MNRTPKTEYVLVRTPRTDSNGERIPLFVHMLKAADTDLSSHSFLRDRGTFEEWVPTNELHLYQILLKDTS